MLYHKKGWIDIQPHLSLSQATSRKIEPRLAHLHRVLADMAMGNRYCQRICRVRLWVGRKL